MKRVKRRLYLVARGAACVSCTAHGWRAFRDPEEKDRMSPCTLAPIYTIEAKNKREAVAMIKARYAAGEKKERSNE